MFKDAVHVSYRIIAGLPFNEMPPNLTPVSVPVFLKAEHLAAPPAVLWCPADQVVWESQSLTSRLPVTEWCSVNALLRKIKFILPPCKAQID